MGGREIVEGKHHVAVLAQTLAGLGIFVLVAAQEAVVGRQGILSGGPARYISCNRLLASGRTRWNRLSRTLAVLCTQHCWARAPGNASSRSTPPGGPQHGPPTARSSGKCAGWRGRCSKALWLPPRRLASPSSVRAPLPHMKEKTAMPPKTKSGLIRVLPVLLGLSGALPTVATEYQAADYLPLEVGNSWTYEHDHADRDADYSQWSTYTAQHPETPQFTIEVLRTEELDGQTYYVISDMPSFWPPPPPHFIAGKTLRWEGTQLMEHSGGGEQALYRFDANETGYTISTDEGDNRVTVKAGADPVPRYFFEFHADAYGDARQGSGFRAGYGYEKGAQLISRDGHSLFTNRLIPLRAVLGGTAVEYEDALIPTSSSSSTWGTVKRSLLARKGTGGGRVR